MRRLMASTEYFDMWFADKQSMINTMIKNMCADLDAGYDYFGKSITQQQQDIAAYKAKFDEELDKLKTMSEKEVEHWCKLDMKKRGVIS